MNPEQKAYAKKISDLKDYIRDIQDILNGLIRDCKHSIISIGWYESAKCEICGTRFGWYCKNSPTKYCEYDYQRFGEMCMYCRHPEERK